MFLYCWLKLKFSKFVWNFTKICILSPWLLRLIQSSPSIPLILMFSLDSITPSIQIISIHSSINQSIHYSSPSVILSLSLYMCVSLSIYLWYWYLTRTSPEISNKPTNTAILKIYVKSKIFQNKYFSYKNKYSTSHHTYVGQLIQEIAHFHDLKAICHLLACFDGSEDSYWKYQI